MGIGNREQRQSLIREWDGDNYRIREEGNITTASMFEEVIRHHRIPNHTGCYQDCRL